MPASPSAERNTGEDLTLKDKLCACEATYFSEVHTDPENPDYHAFVAPVLTVEASLDRLDAALAEMTPEPWDNDHETMAGRVWVERKGQPVALMSDPQRDGVWAEAEANATGIALIRNMASALSAAVRAAEACVEYADKTPSEFDKAYADLSEALAAVAAAGEVE